MTSLPRLTLTRMIIMKRNGYMNVTKLYVLANKRVGDWMDNTYSKELMDEAETGAFSTAKIPGSVLLVKNSSRSDETAITISEHPKLDQDDGV